MVPRPQPINPVASTSAAHSLAILTEYTHTLDSLPLDLSRNFADLRELDAVLSSSMCTLTSKITQLTSMIENKTASKQERLLLLAEIAEEAGRLKPGADDKIRVASHAADGLGIHKSHMVTLMEAMPDQQFGKLAGMLGRKTVYPHVATKSYMPAGMNGEGGRRQRRNAYGSLLARDANDAPPPKRKKVQQGRDDDGDAVTKSPRKDRAAEAQRARGNGRSRKPDRAASPAPSELSVASHLPHANPTTNNNATSAATASRPANNSRQASTVSAVKRSRGGHTTHATSNHADAVRHSATPQPNATNNAPPSTSHPSLPAPFGAQGNDLGGSGVTRAIGNGEWVIGQLEGPGMPVARNTFANTVNATPAAQTTAAQSVEPADAANGDGDGEQDDNKIYCFCNRISYGEMIACDEDNCEREWFHLSCTGLSVPPDGAWFCESCRAKRANKRTARGGKRRGGGARAAARHASN